ncbi:MULTISPECIES: hypothetical protein [unclassified Roseovarius]|uniref:spike base protein, RCAP_Rcc01079 family n=1 Tax=unclassified Roseovarius TaxID=2614913 RepID=UPI00273FACB2|nr:MULTISPECIES: hypothetical protein [unclassified Roseovarius]
MTDNFAGFAASLTSPGETHYVVSPSDTADLDPRPRALKCIASGTVAVRDGAGTDVTYPVEVGDVLEFRAVRVLATGTTAVVVAWE